MQSTQPQPIYPFSGLTSIDDMYQAINRSVFTESESVSIAIRKRYTPGGTSAPKVSTPVQGTVWSPAESGSLINSCMRRPLRSYICTWTGVALDTRVSGKRTDSSSLMPSALGVKTSRSSAIVPSTSCLQGLEQRSVRCLPEPHLHCHHPLFARNLQRKNGRWSH